MLFKFCNLLKSKLNSNSIKIYNLEKLSDGSPTQLLDCVKIRRGYYDVKEDKIPYKQYDYSTILNKNCENVIGYSKIPIGVCGPININDKKYIVPLATTEGALLGSINRGASIINNISKNGIRTVCIDKGMTRAPIIEVDSIELIPKIYKYVNENFKEIKEIFESTTNYGKLINISLHHNGNKVHMRFVATTGDAMGMNMISKGCEKVVSEILKRYSNARLLSLSGNVCTDKKPSAMNWINGRSKTVLCNVKLDKAKLENKYKINTENLVKLNVQKNLIGSALAGSIGGNNSHVANIVSGLFISTGQDTAQIGTSSVCMTDYSIEKDVLDINLTMPSLEVATIGGGTGLETQEGCLELLNIDKNNHMVNPGENSKELAQIIAGTALCGELSLMMALVNNDLVKAHMELNRGTKI